MWESALACDLIYMTPEILCTIVVKSAHIVGSPYFSFLFLLFLLFSSNSISFISFFFSFISFFNLQTGKNFFQFGYAKENL